MLAPADRNPDGAQADFEQSLAWYVRHIPGPIKELFLDKFGSVRFQLGVRIAQSKLFAERDAGFQTAELLCHYLVACGDDAAEVAARFVAHARALPIDLHTTAVPERHMLQVVIGLWADLRPLEEIRVAIDRAGGEALRAAYRAEVDRVGAEDLSDALKEKYEPDQLPPTVLVLLPCGDRLFVLPESRIAVYAERRRAVRESATWTELRERTAHLPPWAGASVPLEKRGAGAITDEERAELDRRRIYPDNARDMWNQFLFYPFRRSHPRFPGSGESHIRRDRELWVRRELEHLGFRFVRETEGLADAFPELAKWLPAPPLLPDPFWEKAEAREAQRAADAAPTASSVPDGPFLVDEFKGSLVVIPETEARRLANLNDAIEESRTWGEFLPRVRDDPDTQEYLARHFEDGLPPSEQSFDSSELPGFDDGDWPAWPEYKMREWLPASVRALGRMAPVATGGSVVHIDETLMNQVTEAFAAEGIECNEDSDGIVRRACGAWRYGM